MTPADRLRELMAADPRPHRELAALANMATARWSNIKTGKILDVEMTTAANVLAALGLDFNALATRE